MREKQNDNYYVNSRGQYEKHNIQYGERLTMLTEDLSEKIEEDSIKSEYVLYNPYSASTTGGTL